MRECTRCGKPTQKLIPFGVEKSLVCVECLQEAAGEGELCPNCGHVIEEADMVGIRLDNKNKSRQEAEASVEATALICPRCRILFFDHFQYNVIQGLKD